MEYGIKKEDMALFALIQFPVMMFSSVASGKLSKDQPLTVVCFCSLLSISHPSSPHSSPHSCFSLPLSYLSHQWYNALRLEMVFSASMLLTIFFVSRAQPAEGAHVPGALYGVVLVLFLAASVANTIKFVLRVHRSLLNTSLSHSPHPPSPSPCYLFFFLISFVSVLICYSREPSS